MNAERSISRYGLYGESLAEQDPEFVHIEDISARSLRYEWRIRPHLHQGMIQLVFLSVGRTRLWLDERIDEVSAPCAVVIPSGVVHGFEFEPGTVGHVVTVADALLAATQDRGVRKQFKALQLKPSTLDFSASPEPFARIAATLSELEKEFQWPERGRNAMLEWLFHALLMLVWRQADLQEVQADMRAGRHDTFTRFRQLVEDHYQEHWDMAAYAQALSVTPATLNRLCRQFAAKGALELIQERLVIAARRHLIYTDASVEAIAYGLGFQDPAYFSRFFKRHTALAPGRYRQMRQAAA
jgi:AraC family transcriptional activator of pobA